MTVRDRDFLINNTLFLLVFCCLASPSSSLETDTLHQGEFLDLANELVSANQLFVLRFYYPDPENSHNIYLGLWYRNTTDYYKRYPVWIGNRNRPFQSNSTLLSLDSFGNLFIKGNTSADSFELYSSHRQTSINATATLLGSGNLVVRETNSNGSAGKLLWQSFDYPTDTLLPGMKLGVNHRTGRNWTLTSWFTDYEPRDGAFSLEWDPVKLRLIVKQRGIIYWTSGSLKDKVFEFFLPDQGNVNYEFMSVGNENEEYFYYELVNTTGVRNIASGWLLDNTGRLRDTRDGFTIAQLEYCYGTTNRSADDLYVKGCESWKQPQCRNAQQMFEFRSGMFSEPSVFMSEGFFDGNSNFTESDCREECWSDCDCVGYLFKNPGCQIWSGPNMKFEQDYAGYRPPLYVLISEAPKQRRNKYWLWILIAACVSIFVVVFLGLGILKKRMIRREKGKRKEAKDDEYFKDLMASGRFDIINEDGIDGRKGHDLMIFNFASIEAATNDFSDENKLGKGGFGTVYKGKSVDGREMAIKRLSRRSGQGLAEFRNELILIAKLQHTNLVRLFGCCIHGDEKILVYEYMPNKSLDYFLFDQKQSSTLDWQKRVKIIEGIAQGLLYLHKYSRMRVIHRDLKASNVLLDGNLNPKISDFGMARIFNQNETEATTNRVVGTYGYMSPEYAMEGTFSEKSDVFSFGVLLLEIVSGRRNSSFYQLDRPLNLVGYAWELWKEGDAMELKDPTLGESFAENQLLRTVHVGLLCVQESATDRPTMSDVISMLGNEAIPLPYPKQPAFFTGRSPHETTSSSEAKAKDYSVNDASITVMEPR